MTVAGAISSPATRRSDRWSDGEGRALDPFGEPIAGLFAAGNTTAHPMGPGYPATRVPVAPSAPA